MIAVDWGTSNFRAFRLDAQGAVAARRSSGRGMLAVPAGKFEAALRAEIAPWLADGETQVLLCGMVGSRQGWVEAPYLPCPAGLAELANAVVAVPFAGAQVRLVPGVSAMTGVPELMRGEESAAIGICDSDGMVCFPGTHSKWVQLGDRKIVSFTTAMTGEVFSALRKCTILGRMMTDNLATDKAAFLAGVSRSADGGGLLHHLFGVRTLTLTSQLQEDASASYLSGLLIGHEVRAAMPRSRPVHLAGSPALCELYVQAIHACGGEAKVEDEDAAALGLAAIGGRLQWT